MMGPTHALSAGVAFVAVASPLSHYVHHLTPATAVVGAVVAAGAGILPDFDHHNATPARAFGPLSAGAAWTVGKISGGHRHGTHSIIGTIAAVALTVAALHNMWATAAVIWLCLGLGVRALWHRPPNRPNGKLDYRDVAGIIHAGAAAFVAWRIAASGLDLAVLPDAVCVGYLTHLVGDSMTEMGVNWLYPFSRKSFRIASIDTGKNVEKWVVVPGLYLLLGFIAYRTHDQWAHAILTTIR